MNKKKARLFTALLGLVATALLCNGIWQRYWGGTYAQKLTAIYHPAVPLIQPDSLWHLMQQGPHTPVLLDARTLIEYQVSHIKGAHRVAPTASQWQQVLQGQPKNTPIVVYCTVGQRSQALCQALQQAGFTQVSNLYGGIIQWQNQQLPLQGPRQKATQKVHTYNYVWSKWLSKGTKVY